MTTAVDNTAAEAATTAADAMSLSAYNCMAGDDSTCVTAYGAGSCCFMAEVGEISANQTEEQKSYEMPQAMFGWPTAVGESNNLCLDPANVAYYAAFTMTDENAMWTQYYTGSMLKGYCVSAVKLAATISAGAAVIFATSF